MLPDYSEAKDKMVAVRYRNEQDVTRLAGIDACEKKDLVVELYAGNGGSTKLFQNAGFKQIVSNDINPESVATFTMSADKFIGTELPNLPKIDLIDFDAYGCPSEEIKKYFSLRQRQDLPLVVTVSDGLGIWMKRSKNTDRLRQRYLLEDMQFDERHPWREHPILLDRFMHNIGKLYMMDVTTLVMMQTKFKNYTLGAWLFK